MDEDLIKVESVLVGVAGEYLVAGELSKRGFVASISLRNTRGIDIIVANRDASKSAGIQVKASSVNRKAWILNKKGEDYFSDTLFYVFVNLNGLNERLDFYIVPSKIVANSIKIGHKEWLKGSSKLGIPHKDNPIRLFVDKEDKYLERWDLLDLD